MIEIRYNIVRFNTNLPYNCVYYIYDGEKNENFTMPDSFACKYVTKEQGFGFHFRKVNYESLTEEMLLKENCIAPNPDKTLIDEIIRILRNIFPKSEHGCFMVRLLPYCDNDNDNEADTFMIGEIVKESSRDDAENFIRKAARQNYKRLNDFQNVDYQDTYTILDDYASLYAKEPSGFNPDYQISFLSARNYSYPTKPERQQQLKNDSLKKFKDVIIDPKSTPEQIKNVLYGICEDFENMGKLNTDYPIKIYQDDKGNYGIFICPDGDEPIICDFSRGDQSQALYVFFLRHPEGVRLKDLKEQQNVQEIAQIYAEFKICDMDTALQRAKSAVENINVYKKDINDLFNKIFVSTHACNYIIAPLDHQAKCKYSINLNEDLIDLGIFNKAL